MTEPWLRLARRADIVRRSLAYAAIVGPVLVAINHGDALLQGNLDGQRAIKIALTFCVPYLVATFSSVAALRARP